MKIRITQRTPEFEALGAYLVGSVKDGIGEIMIDIEGIESSPDMTIEDKKGVIVNVLKHELHHALSDFFGIPLEDPDGLCGGDEGNQVMYIVPLDEHEAIVAEKDNRIAELERMLK